ncbi:SDR family NAD(P)-dependent oxidoreductase [Actinoplanes awajinensis]|uniref:Short-chain dehydrogenase n=1 Tax=Actinoplanes awajinensis subsp. mycoplanecinus TaxID=135947 RepID=A0A124G7J1_9ACTN|nr:SDR family oxidoreductase [Actinoplanes awajinensis]KUL22987.1 short-chain dehydrogenase [Actinoplanes awajinensis subsp. mycoplanecinus]
MTERFAGKIALVTGGGSGIGRNTARALAAEGATVIVAGRNRAALEEAGGIPMVADVSVEQDVAALLDAIGEKFGRLDVAVNNAGVFGGGMPLAEMPSPEWDRLVATNLTGVYLAMKHEIGLMRPTGGTIVNVASNIGAHGRRPGLGAYAATKAAVSALTRNTALEYIRDGIRINAVSPGPADTTMSLFPGETADDRAARLAVGLPIGRVGSLDEITSAVLWLASPESAFTVGHDLVIDGGATA